jgi:hypothetical protein
MPQIVRTPEQVLRETKHDLYYIGFHEWDPFKGSKQQAPGKSELLQWFQNRLPHVELEELAPSEFSGYITGGFGQCLRVDFGESDLDLYVATWEEPDGASKDERWTCYHYPLDMYLAKVASDQRLPDEEDHSEPY